MLVISTKTMLKSSFNAHWDTQYFSRDWKSKVQLNKVEHTEDRSSASEQVLTNLS